MVEVDVRQPRPLRVARAMHPFAILRGQPRTSLSHFLQPIATLVALSALATALTLLDLLALLRRAVPLCIAVLLALAIQARTIATTRRRKMCMWPRRTMPPMSRAY